MSILSCVNRIPIELKGYENLTVRCRKCKPCRLQRQFEWKNRMLLENWGRDSRPLFLTWTFRPANYEDNRLYVLRETQKLYKRLRRLGHDIRYFTSIERGTKNGRLHAHSIVWSQSLSDLPWTDLFWTLLNTWGLGGIKLRYVQSPGAFHYTAKYIIKDQISDTDCLTGELIRSRNYTWSNRPRLGDPGLQRWEYLSDKMFHVEQLPVNWFHMPFFGKLEKAYIPSDNWKKYVKAKRRDIEVPDIQLYYDGLEEQIQLLDHKPPTVVEWIDKHVSVIE